MWAARENHVEIARILLEGGAAIDARNEYESTPLMWAAQQRHERCVVALIEAKASHATSLTRH